MDMNGSKQKKQLSNFREVLTGCCCLYYYLLRYISTVFENLLTRPDADYEIAFRLFDTAGSGKITREQFKQILSANIGKDAIPFDFECEWLKLYTGGKTAAHEMPYKEFTQLLKGLQAERLRQAFKYYDTQTSGYITPDEFKKIMIDIAGHKLSDHVLENLPTLSNVYAGNKISFANVMAFYNVIREMDMVERVVRSAVTTSKDGTITKADFLLTAAKETRFSLFTPMEADIIFHFAGLENASGKLTLRDFFRLLESKWEHAVPVAAAQPEIKHGAMHDFLKGSCKFQIPIFSRGLLLLLPFFLSRPNHKLLLEFNRRFLAGIHQWSCWCHCCLPYRSCQDPHAEPAFQGCR